jgi:hypothetical protein
LNSSRPTTRTLGDPLSPLNTLTASVAAWMRYGNLGHPPFLKDVVPSLKGKFLEVLKIFWLSTNWRDKDWASLRYAPWRAVIHNSKATLDAYNVQKTGPICCLTPQIWGDPIFFVAFYHCLSSYLGLLLVSNVPTRARLVFEEVDSQADKVALLLLRCRDGDGQFDVEYRNVPLVVR